MNARLRLLAVPTAKQPASLQRTLRSFAEHLAGVGRPLPTAVFHSPRTAAEQTEVQAAVIAAGGTAQYVGLREKLAVAKQLLKATGVAPELLEFALFQNEHAAHGAGADRNAALLWGAGGQILCTDDDTRAEFFTHAERLPDESLSITRSGEPQETGSGAAPASAHGGIAGVFEDAWDAALWRHGRASAQRAIALSAARGRTRPADRTRGTCRSVSRRPILCPARASAGGRGYGRARPIFYGTSRAWRRR